MPRAGNSHTYSAAERERHLPTSGAWSRRTPFDANFRTGRRFSPSPSGRATTGGFGRLRSVNRATHLGEHLICVTLAR